ncbi:tyrosine-type recombinase/integrase [Actinomadura sp. PM05-2]|uniref:Tyrosine-type recombinase/integrase n=1 Tax=Actinomadura parmotrematis TaxID=2864039 RepID=A0ABS7FNH7_9ACTN|nr:tyrosine-type recombinase/integrase [Actinomadura parmotrematis]
MSAFRRTVARRRRSSSSISHDLRHGAAKLSLLGKVDMKVISEMLGHARFSFTADTYTSVLPEVSTAAAEAVAAVVPRE